MRNQHRSPEAAVRWGALLTTAQREEIVQRYLDGETKKSLALEFGVSASYIDYITPSRRSR